MRETWVQSLDWDDPLEKDMATHSSIVAWRIPWTEEPGGLWAMGSQRVRHDWATRHGPQWSPAHGSSPSLCFFGAVCYVQFLKPQMPAGIFQASPYSYGSPQASDLTGHPSPHRDWWSTQDFPRGCLFFKARFFSVLLDLPIVGLQFPRELPGYNQKLTAIHREQGETQERGKSFQVGRWWA